MDAESAELDAFVAKVDAFAASLSPQEQAMFAELLDPDGSEVAGFGFDQPWPGLKAIAPLRFDAANKIVATGGGSDIFMAEPNDIVTSGGGSDI